MPAVIPFFKDPFWGVSVFSASYHGCYSFLCFLSGFLFAGVRKTQEDTLKVFILSKILRHAEQQTQGGIECGTQTNIKYIYSSGD